MPDQPPTFSLRSDPATTQLEVTFVWREDRFAHVVELVSHTAQGIDRQILLQSMEGTAQENWPASPPLQACQSLDDTEILATGMAGATHWSLAFTKSEEGLIWDAACRVQQPPPQIGSTYKCHVPIHYTGDGEAILVPGRGRPCRLLASAAMDTNCHLVAANDVGDVRIQAHPNTALPATVRWQYRLRLDTQHD